MDAEDSHLGFRIPVLECTLTRHFMLELLPNRSPVELVRLFRTDMWFFCLFKIHMW